MKAWPHTHIGIARDEYGLFIGTKFLGSGKGSPLDQLLQYYPEVDSAIIFPLEEGTRWELEEVTTEVKTTEWVTSEELETLTTNRGEDS